MTSVATNESALFDGACSGNMARVQAALAAGASVDGSPELPFAPVVVAAAKDETGVVKFLIEQGSDPKKPARSRLQCPSSDMQTVTDTR